MSSTSNENLGNRSSHWFGGMVFCAVALTALVTLIGTENIGDSSDNQWAVAAVSITLGLSILSVFGSFLLREKFSGTALEGGMSVLVFAFWAAVLPAIMKPGNGYATGSGGGVVDANLYFFSWGAFVTSLLIFMGYLVEAYGIGTGKNTGFSPFGWSTLCMASFIVMVTSIRLWDDGNICDKRSEAYCNRLKFSLSLGVVSAAITGLWVGFGAFMPAMFDTILAVVMFIAWIFGVAFTTFGGMDAPGSQMGNLYFFTWASFATSMFMAINGIHRVTRRDTEEETTGEEEKNAPDAEKGAEEGEKPEEEVTENA